MTDEERGQLERIFITDKLTNPDSNNYATFKGAVNDRNEAVLYAVDAIIAEGPGGNTDNSPIEE